MEDDSGVTPALAHHDGRTYVPRTDHTRLNRQLRDVFRLMRDGWWRTLKEIARVTGHPEASVSARLRDLRKPKFGGHLVKARRVRGVYFNTTVAPAGLWEYQVITDPTLSVDEALKDVS